MDFDELKIFRQLCGCPERVCWAVAEYRSQRSICPLGWHMWTSAQPPLMAVSVAPQRFTHDLIARSGELVLAWPGADLTEATLLCGTHNGRTFDKFAECNLTPQPATHVKAPLIVECLANLECRVVGQLTTGDHTIFAAQILAVHINHPDGRQLCTINEGEGYQLLLETSGYRFGVVKK